MLTTMVGAPYTELTGIWAEMTGSAEPAQSLLPPVEIVIDEPEAQSSKRGGTFFDLALKRAGRVDLTREAEAALSPPRESQAVNPSQVINNLLQKAYSAAAYGPVAEFMSCYSA